MWLFYKEKEPEQPPKEDPRLKEVEEKYPIGTICTLFGQEVTVTTHHNSYFYNAGRYWWDREPGVHVHWWNTNKDLNHQFIPYNELRFLEIKQ